MQKKWIKEVCRDEFGPRNFYPNNAAIKKLAEKMAKDEGRGKAPASMVVLFEQQVYSIHFIGLVLEHEVRAMLLLALNICKKPSCMQASMHKAP